MTAGQTTTPPKADAIWSGLHEATRRCLDDYLGADATERAGAQKRLLLALELGWKLEEQVLLPALHEGDVRLKLDTDQVLEEIEKLRDLADLVEEGTLDPASNLVVLNALEGIAELRAARVEEALHAAKNTPGVNAAALAQDMNAMLKRWREEISATGDIEDEERDPVGKPPR